MSHKQDSNFDDLPQDVSALLGSLQPEPLELARDELFFRAGFEAAGVAKSNRITGSSARRYFWPAAAAALLAMCIGMGAATIHQSAAIAALHGELAAAQSSANSPPTVQIAQLPTKSNSREENRWLTDPFQRQWQKLASPAPLARGQLSAMGWTDLPRQLGDAELENGNPNFSNQSDTGKSEGESKRQELHKPATYLELLRLEQPS